MLLAIFSLSRQRIGTVVIHPEDLIDETGQVAGPRYGTPHQAFRNKAGDLFGKWKLQQHVGAQAAELLALDVVLEGHVERGRIEYIARVHIAEIGRASCRERVCQYV